MHNTYLDLVFEYGVLPMALVFAACAIAFFRILWGGSGVPRFWIFYLVAAAVVAIGQHLLFSFTSMCLLMPAFLLIPRVLLAMGRTRFRLRPPDGVPKAS
jgi:hypothetical protein